MSNLLPTSTLREFGGEPRIKDVDLGFSLGVKNPQSAIRQLVERNRPELESHGEICTQQIETSLRGGRPGKAYYLNEGQALVICALSRTEKAAQIRKLIIDVFMAWRRGKTVDVKEHYRRPPAPSVDDGHFHMKQSAPGKLIRVDALVPFDLASEYAMMFSNYRRVTF